MLISDDVSIGVCAEDNTKPPFRPHEFSLAHSSVLDFDTCMKNNVAHIELALDEPRNASTTNQGILKLRPAGRIQGPKLKDRAPSNPIRTSAADLFRFRKQPFHRPLDTTDTALLSQVRGIVIASMAIRYADLQRSEKDLKRQS